MEVLKNILGRYISIMDWLYWGSAGPREIGVDLRALSELCGALLSAPITMFCLFAAVVVTLTESQGGLTKTITYFVRNVLIALGFGVLFFWAAKFAVYMLFTPPPKFYLLGPIGFLLTLLIIAANVAIVVSIVYAVWQTVAITIEPTPSGLSSKPVVKAVPKIDPVAAPAAAPRAAPPAPQVSKNKGPILVYPYQPITATFNRPTPVSKSAATGKPAKPQSETEATMNALNQYLKL